MKRLSSKEFRNMWFEFWKSKDHEIIPSSPLIPIDDDSLLWINAGVTPIKKYFDGTLVPKNKRMANSQKCIRTNDIENVGVTARHHTFFEMLGNFSIGDYFKKEALTWAWEFLTSKEWLDLDKDKLYVTVYPQDKETVELWKNIGLSEDRIIPLPGNFWEIGEGPCGPDSEIFYDRGEKFDPEKVGLKLLIEDLENDRYVEIWNNVFSQYNSLTGKNREDYPELPSKNIDTGMGLERVVAILQDGETNYDTDLFIPILEKIEELANIEYTGQMSFKIIADHIRTVVMALSDDANFGNTGRNYIIRRLIRRAIRHGKKLGIKENFVEQLVDPIVYILGDHYENIKLESEAIKRKIRREEELFSNTLNDGLKKLDELIINSQSKELEPSEVFKLYDTYGLPFDLTREYAEEKGYTVDEEKTRVYLNAQQELARRSQHKTNIMNIQNEDLLNFKEKSTFTGYDNIEEQTKIIAIFEGDKLVKETSIPSYIALEKTPYYIEKGGQVEDHGYITINQTKYTINGSFLSPNQQTFHQINLDQPITINQEVTIEIDTKHRDSIKKNHSAAHLLQSALIEVLGPTIKQAGSKINVNNFRFDFTYEFKISNEDIIKIEQIVNHKIMNIPTKTVETNIETAKEMGAIALFSEKYEDKVRVVCLGDSIELCGGTHVNNLSDINKIALASLENKGNNLYRITGSTDQYIEEILYKEIKPYNKIMKDTLTKAKKILEEASQLGIELNFNFDIDNSAPQEYKDVIYNLEEMNKLKKDLANLEQEYTEEKNKLALDNINQFLELKEEINGINTIIIKTNNYDIKTLKVIIDELINKLENGFVFIANQVGNQNVNFLAKAAPTLTNKLNCGDIIRNASKRSNGNGGGSQTFAQGGGTTNSYVDQIIETIKTDLK